MFKRPNTVLALDHTLVETSHLSSKAKYLRNNIYFQKSLTMIAMK